VLAARVGVVVASASLLLAASTPCAAARRVISPGGSPGAPPRVLNIVHVKVKPRSAAAYAALEAQIVRAYERARVKVYWICLQGPKDATDVLYLNLYDSAEASEQAAATYRDAIKQHPELAPPQQRLTDLTVWTTSTLTTRRDDVDRVTPDADFATLRSIRMTTFQVMPGHEGGFLNAIRTTSPKEGSWLVYEANDSSTYALITLTRKAIGRRGGPTVPRSLRRFKGMFAKTETHVYAVRPSMSHVSQAFVAANPQLWRPVAATH
jgi:hypothetical protein